MQPQAQCVSLHAGECLRDLLDMAAKLLRPGGRLVYFMPAAPEVYKEKEIPQHPALEAHCQLRAGPVHQVQPAAHNYGKGEPL